MIFLFAVLEIVPRKKEKYFLKHIFHKAPSMDIERIALRGGAFFYTVKAYANKNGEIDETYLKSVIGSSTNRILLKDNTMLPQNTTLHLFKPSLLPYILFMNTSFDFLNQTGERETRILGILDPDAYLLKCILRFAPLAKRILVLTNHPEAYEATKGEMLRTYGLPLELTDSFQKIKSCDVILEPFYKATENSFGLIHLRGNLPCCFRGEGVVLPKELAARCPDGIDPVLFLAALYEICNIKGIESLSYAKRIRIKAL